MEFDLEKARAILTTHATSKLNGRFPSQFTHQHEMTNPICGDHVQLKFNIHQNHISDIGFFTQACAICSASASLMTELIKGQSLDTVRKFAGSFEDSLLAPATAVWPSALNTLKSFEHLKINPARKACALLPWIALKSAVKEIL